MNEKNIMIDAIRNLEHNNYNEIESYRILLLTLLLFYDNNEQDAEIWDELLRIIRKVVDEYSVGNEDYKHSVLHSMNREDYGEIVSAEEKYANMSEVLKLIMSQRVMCPKSEGKNFKAFF